MRTLAHSARRVKHNHGGEFLAPPLDKILPSPVDRPDRVAYFIARVEKGEGCWEWQGSRSATGYGTMHIGKRDGRRIAGEYSNLAHRMAYALWVGPIPDGMVIDHLCRNRACCNPAHLEPVTQSENAKRSSPPKTHCVNGHEYSDANTYWSKGKRSCRTCTLTKQREAYARKKAS